jgi:hypothetical protein
MESRGIVLLFPDHGTRRWWEVSVTPRPLFTPGKDPVIIVQEAGGLQTRFGQVRKISPPPGFDRRTVQPVAIRYTDYATRPTVFVARSILYRILGCQSIGKRLWNFTHSTVCYKAILAVLWRLGLQSRVIRIGSHKKIGHSSKLISSLWSLKWLNSQRAYAKMRVIQQRSPVHQSHYSWYTLMTCVYYQNSKFAWKDWQKTVKTSARTACVWNKFCTRNLLNKRQEWYPLESDFRA